MVTVKITIPEQEITLFPDQANWLKGVFDRFKIKYDSVSYCSDPNKKGHYFVEYKKKFSTRALNCIHRILYREGISYEESTMEGFASLLSKKEFRMYRGNGKRTLTEIDDVFESLGIYWSKE